MTKKHYKTLRGVYGCAKKETAARRGSEQEAAEGVGAPSQYQKDILRIWNDHDYGCQTSHYKRILEATVGFLTGETVVLDERKGKVTRVQIPKYRYTVVIPTGNVNAHNYPLSRPCLVMDARLSFCWSMEKLNIGNHLGDLWRFATDEEIDAWFEEIKANEAAKRSLLEQFAL